MLIRLERGVDRERVKDAYSIAVYRRDGLAYGGPEEGGWWYETGTCIAHIARFYRTREAALAACARRNRMIERLQRNHRSVSSAAYDGSRYCYRVAQGVPNPVYPMERPYYE